MLNRVILVLVQDQLAYNGLSRTVLKTGYRWDSDNYFMDETNYKRIKSLIDFINQPKKLSFKKGAKIYASKVSDIPRFKLKEFIKDKGLNKTSRVNQSDYIIINQGCFNSLIESMKLTQIIFVKEDYMKSHLIPKPKLSGDWLDKEYYNLFTNAKDKNLVGMIKMSEEYFREKLKKYPSNGDKIDSNTHLVTGVCFDLHRDNKTNVLLNLLADNEQRILNGDTQIIFDEELFTELNKDGIELDDEYLSVLKDMLFSEDEDNIKLGFEMMSNLVITNKTLLSISFLLNTLYNDHYFRPSKYTQTNSNLKSLLKLFKTKGIHWNDNWKTFGMGLRANFKTGEEGEIVKKFLLENINEEFRLNNSASEALVDIIFSTETK